jgi:hypothetical protein
MYQKFEYQHLGQKVFELTMNYTELRAAKWHSAL